ncbi:hypothetical protein JQX13_16435 [Archangium violaceum]|uniref:porin n=1 Tax=Archangium violaceum TaxID=83451 RepID=UPI00193BB7A1|nr:porin [Archangium violaceum]QRK11516.1 hypothetical protein JQX13_16435 [Archangium violaceum]
MAICLAALVSGPVQAQEDTVERQTVASRDLSPSVRVVETEQVTVALGALTQIQLAPLASRGVDAEGGDAATAPGFRIRRARLGVSTLIGPRVELLLTANLLETDPEIEGTIADAQLAFEIWKGLEVALGTLKPPFSRSALAPSSQLSMVERPFTVTELTPARRLGLVLGGKLPGDRLTYLVSVMNGTPGFAMANLDRGVMFGARVELAPWTFPSPQELSGSGVSFGLSAFRQEGGNDPGEGLSADLLGVWRGASALVEVICARGRTGDSPDRCGGYLELGYAFPVWGRPVQVVARGELFDGDRVRRDEQDLLLLSGGLNVPLVEEHLRAQLQYLARRERFGARERTEGLVLAFQGSF